MNTDDLLLFAEVAHAGSFAAVAKARETDPSAVSRTIAALEASVGTRLFHRTTRRMSLTEEGEHFLATAVPLAEELAVLKAQSRGNRKTPSGNLRLTASVSFGQTVLLPLLPEFRALYPDVTLECVFTDTNLDLIADRIDLAVRMGTSVEGDVIVTKLADTRYKVVASPEYLKTHGVIQKPEELMQHDCILFTLRKWRSQWVFKGEDGTTSIIPVTGSLHLSPAGAVRDAAVAGLGPALMADCLVDHDIASGALVDLFPSYQVSATTFDTAAWLVYPSRSYLPAKTRVMIDFLKERF